MNNEELLAAYQQMRFIRAFEQRLNELFLQGIVAGTTHLCIGQEACAVGVCAALETPDVVFSNHRGHGHLLARGGDPGRLMAEIFGQPTGYSGGRGGSQHIAVKDINFYGTHGITAGTMPLAVGVALHKKKRNEPGAAVVFLGEGATGEGIFHESLNMAALWQVPVFFVCENNQYAMSSAHRDFSPVPQVADRASAYGMTATTIDGNDVVGVCQTIRGFRQQMADEPQPVLVELMTYRQSGHSRGDPCVYRTREEEEEWRARDPIARAHDRLVQAACWDDGQEATLEANITERVAAAEAFARPEESANA